MAMQEIYIRSESETEARGPYNLDQLSTLVDAGQLTADTLFYDATTEAWVPINSNAEMKGLLFPEKKKLVIRAPKKLETLNKEEDSAPPITVDDMLAAAEGRTSDTKDKRDPAEDMARAAAIGRWAIIVMLIVAAAGELLPSTDAVLSMDPAKLLASPLVFLGALDILLAVMLVLGVVSLYPFIRFRAALGLGFLGFIFWTHGEATAVLALAAGSVGLYLGTVFITYLPVIIVSALGLLGLGAVAWKLIS